MAALRPLVFVALVVGCGSDAEVSSSPGPTPDAAPMIDEGVRDEGVRDGGAGDAEDARAAVSSVFRTCGPPGPLECDGLGAFASCASAACDAELVRCFGAGYLEDDFSGSVCAEHAACKTTADDPCASDCSPTAPCAECLVALTVCLETSACAAPSCTPETSDQPTPPSEPPKVEGTCADLEACCGSLEGVHRDACAETLAGARAARGEADCAVVVSTYRAAGACD